MTLISRAKSKRRWSSHLIKVRDQDMDMKLSFPWLQGKDTNLGQGFIILGPIVNYVWIILELTKLYQSSIINKGISLFYIFILWITFEFKFQKLFDQNLESFEFHMNFRSS
jgi:hypothetical protein